MRLRRKLSDGIYFDSPSRFPVPLSRIPQPSGIQEREIPLLSGIWKAEPAALFGGFNCRRTELS